MTRKIIHLDLDAFFCAVEEQRDPSLRGKAFAVGGRPEARGVVASCSYAARKFGIHSAMPMARAMRLCPGLIIVSHRHGAYGQVSQKVMGRLRSITEKVEQISIDEAFLDVSDRPEPAAEIARQLQTTIREELGLPCSLGVASNKLVAKIATDVGKAAARGEGPPNAIQEVPPGREAAFLAPLPVSALWGVGPKTSARLEEIGVHTIGDLAAWPAEDLARRFGKHGRDLARRARGIDDRLIVQSREAKSISRETTFARDVRDQGTLQRTLREQSASVGRRLRRANLAGATVKIKVRWPDFTTLTRQRTLEQPTDHDEEIYQNAARLFEEVWRSRRPVRLLGVGVSGLGRPWRQLTLWEGISDEPGRSPEAVERFGRLEREKQRRLRQAFDRLEDRFGAEVVWWGSGKPASRTRSRE